MSAPVTEWLSNKGYNVWCEIPFHERVIDIVGMRENDLIAVELKKSFARKVFYQASTCQIFARQVYCCAFTNPSKVSIKRAKLRGLGLLRVGNGICHRILEHDYDNVWEPEAERMRERLKMLEGYTHKRREES